MDTKTFSLALSIEEHHELYRTWRELFAKRECSPVDFLIYALLRSKDPRAGFTPISNIRKLSNGMTAERSYRSTLVSAMSGHLLSAKLRGLFPTVSAERLAELVGGLGAEASVLYYGKKEA